VPDRAGNGTGELIVLLTTVTDPADACAEALRGSVLPRWAVISRSIVHRQPTRITSD